MRDVIGAYPWYRCLHSPEPVSAYSKGSLSLKPLGFLWSVFFRTLVSWVRRFPTRAMSILLIWMVCQSQSVKLGKVLNVSDRSWNLLAEAKTDNSNCQNCGIQKFRWIACFCDAVEMRSSSSFVSSYLFVSCGVWSLLLGLGMTIPSLTGSYQSVPFLEALLSSITQALASSLIRLARRC